MRRKAALPGRAGCSVRAFIKLLTRRCEFFFLLFLLLKTTFTQRHFFDVGFRHGRSVLQHQTLCHIFFFFKDTSDVREKKIVTLCQSVTAGKYSPNFILHTFLETEVHWWDFF